MSKPKHMIWLDLETTGLDPANNRVIEVAAFRADFDNPFDIAELPDAHIILRQRDWTDVDDFVVQMHGKSGLMTESMLSKVESVSKADTELFDAFYFVIAQVSGQIKEEHKAVLAGSSVHFDLAFIRAHFPRFSSLLTYRTYDVSAIKLFCMSQGMPAIPKPAEGAAHRAIDDIRASVDHARKCKQWLEGDHESTAGADWWAELKA